MAAITLERLMSKGWRSAKGKRRQFFVVGKLPELTRPFDRRSVGWEEAIDNAAERATTWISTSSAATDKLVEVASRHLEAGPKSLGDLLMVESPRVETLPALSACFDHISGQVRGYAALPPRELAEVLKLPQEEARDLFIGGSYDAATSTLTLTRGDFKGLVVPLSVFDHPGATRPDPGRLSFTDYGHTVRLGDFEASADAILYEVDPDYRKRLNKRRRQTDKGFGPSLRRLRTQKRLTQADFAPLTAKTIARIERGEVAKPQGKTLGIIAQRLGVPADEIEEY